MKSPAATCICGQEFKTAAAFLKHSEAGHAGPTVTCGCGASFADIDADGYVDHLETAHPPAGLVRFSKWLAKGRAVLGMVETVRPATS